MMRGGSLWSICLALVAGAAVGFLGCAPQVGVQRGPSPLLMSEESGDSDAAFRIPKSLLSKKPFSIANEIGVGTRAWGDESMGFVGDPRKRPKAGEFNPADLQMAYNTLVEAGVTFFDTADVYGCKSIKEHMSSEQLLGRFGEENYEERAQVATKYTPVLWTNLKAGGGLRAGRRAVANALQQSCDRLGVAYVDLYQLHFPFPYIGGLSAIAEGMSRARDRGLCRAVGVSNMNAAQVRDFHDKLSKWDVPLASNQVEFSLINQDSYEDGTIAECKRLGIVVIAHTPLAKGLATGVYTAANPTGGKTGAPKYSYKDLAPLMPVHQALADVAKLVSARLSEDEEAPVRKRCIIQSMHSASPELFPHCHVDTLSCQVTTTQVSLNYIRAKGIVPIPGVTSRAEAEEVAGCLGWRLNGEEVEALDDGYRAYKKGTSGKTVSTVLTF
ncbi:unnamed protein product [Chrysoparadoxa australica]